MALALLLPSSWATYLGGEGRSEKAAMEAPPVRRLLSAAMAVRAAAFCDAEF